MGSDQETIGIESTLPEEPGDLKEEPMETSPKQEVEEIGEHDKQGLDESVGAAIEEQSSPTDDLPPEGTQRVSEQDDSHPMDALLDAESYELEMPRRGEIRTGTIARVTETDILVDVGAKSEGVISNKELERLSEDDREQLNVGKEVSVYVVHSGGRDGTLVLSIMRAEEEQDWQQAEHLLKSQALYEGIVTGYNKGGLIIKLGGLRGFIPASQVSLSRRRRAQGETPDQRWSKMVDEPIIAKVIEVDRRRNRLILSERAAAREARDALKERLITELQAGEIREGHVISLADFGAFIDIGGADGLVHMSEISWKRISHPRELLKVGQKVEVKVLGVDPERKRISLSLRELEIDPWEQIAELYSEGQLVEGTITKITKFGAFASLVGSEDYDIEGLIHISELSDRRIEHPREAVQEGQSLAVRVIKIDKNRRRIGLSLKRVDSPEYAEQDWKAAMQDLDEEEIGLVADDEVEDFDAALEAEASAADAEDIAEEAVVTETLGDDTESPEAVIAAEPIEELEEVPETDVDSEVASEEEPEIELSEIDQEEQLSEEETHPPDPEPASEDPEGGGTEPS